MTYYGPKEMAASFRTVRDNTIKIAEEIPEENYGFRSAPRDAAAWPKHWCTLRSRPASQEQITCTETSIPWWASTSSDSWAR